MVLAVLAAVLLGLAFPAAAGDSLRRPAGSVVVPEHFLRAWDPVTVFFDQDAGPAKGGPEDHAERHVQVSPPHPGAFTWLNARTLQFRPTVAWPPMARFAWTVQGRQTALVSLMAAPTASVPAADAVNLAPVRAVTLTFAEPVDAQILARLVTIELRPLPGVGGDQARVLDAHDFTVKAAERQRPNDPAPYVLDLHHPIPWGTRAVVRVKLSPDQGSPGEDHRVAFATAAPFHVTQLGCRDTAYPLQRAGAAFAREQALTCPTDDRAVVVSFSEAPQPIGPVEARNLVRFSPQVEDLRFETVANTLVVRGRFAADTLYQVRVEPTPVRDVKNRVLDLGGASQLYLSFPARPGMVKWAAGQGIAERFGPQMVPVRARGVERVDLRIHPVDPLDRSLWPFPDKGVSIDDGARPPAPGEEPAPSKYFYDPDATDIGARIRAFGSPSVSELVTLSGATGEAAASFGIDLKPALARISGDRPGHYLVGIRRLGGENARQWMRLQVTDLSLTAVEESDRVAFAVTSLSTGQPVAGATIAIDADNYNRSATVGTVVSGADGTATWAAPGPGETSLTPKRIVVTKGEDVLVLDLDRPPRAYAEGGWRDESERSDDSWTDRSDWLRWTLRDTRHRAAAPRDLCHIFTERPIYRPDEPVHIKAYLRRYKDGVLSLSDKPGTLVVTGPDGTEWRYPLHVNAAGSAYHKFDAKTAATGVYKVAVDYSQPGKKPASDDDAAADEPEADASGCHTAKFKKEAYRLPRFEVSLNAPAATALDAAFKVDLSTEYYAGGVLAERPLRWRVTQIPFAWTPKARPGFVFSTDQRFSGTQPFRASPAVERDTKTDAQGAATLTLDPTIEPTAQPRKYVVEATVVGDDDQTVTNTHEVLALPPFAVGVKLPRFLERAATIDPLVVVQDGEGRALAGQPVTVRLVRRQWNSILQATDFTQGQAKYITEVIEDTVAEQSIVSGVEPTRVSFPIQGAGVFVVEVDSHDRLGRLQTVKVDLFAGGERPTTWAKPPAEVFTVAPDQTAHAPGETAKMVLQSPFQTARALAVVEEPDGHNLYRWVEVKNGYGTFDLVVKPEYLPRVAVHFVLMRGRLPGDDSLVTAHADLRKPATLAATQWVTVSPAKHVVKVDLTYPRKAQPGQDVDITVALADDKGRPLAGEVTLWLVDQAVLALAREARLDPLPHFVVPRKSRTTLRDTRNMAFGLLPLQEEPGGDEGDDGSPLQRVSVRRNFTPVPYYEPSLAVGPSGRVTVKVRLPDSLTNFKLRAKAVSGPQRFGYGTGDMHVRLPVLVQPALPRFVRPGDSFAVSAVGRVVDTVGGPGRAQVKLGGLDLVGSESRAVDWQAAHPQRLDFPVRVPAGAGGTVQVSVAVERAADGARDAFQVDLPVQPDREPVVLRSVAALDAATPVRLAAVTEPVRPGSLSRDVLVAGRELAALAAGLDYLRGYPFGCTEQRLSQTRALIGARRLGPALVGADSGGASGAERLTTAVAATQEWLGGVAGGNGLVAFWPGGRGSVALTAWGLQFLTEAKAAGLPVDTALHAKLAAALKQSLRSDGHAFVDGGAWFERTTALAALSAAGLGDPAYAAELARKAPSLSAESLAQVVGALARAPGTPPATVAELQQRLWRSVVTRLDHGREVYGGLQEDGTPSEQILPSEARTVAQILRASLAADPAQPKNRLLADALVTLGAGDGWGTTNADAEALLALADWLAASPAPTSAERRVSVAFGADRRSLILPATAPAARATAATADAAVVTQDGAGGEPLTVWSRVAFVPVADGSTVAAAAQGFAVDREVWVVAADGAPPRRVSLASPGTVVTLPVGAVVEDHVTVVNPIDRVHVAVVVPLAAGVEPLNPRLATAPPEAQPSQPLSLEPSYAAVLDDKVSWFYDQLPKGTYHFYIRSRATVPGRFIQPPAAARAMYDDTKNGNGNGAVVVVTRP